MLKTLHTEQNAEFLLMLLKLRHQRQLRQVDLARLLGKSQATVSKVERGVRRLDLIELRQWLAALEVDFLEFMNEFSSRLSSALTAHTMGTAIHEPRLRTDHPENELPGTYTEGEPPALP